MSFIDKNDEVLPFSSLDIIPELSKSQLGIEVLCFVVATKAGVVDDYTFGSDLHLICSCIRFKQFDILLYAAQDRKISSWLSLGLNLSDSLMICSLS